jgi:UDP-4-amino-4,6-dideoxy-N-acetyl-beta-L-altrosamine transaminase
VIETLALHGGVPVRPSLLPYARQAVDEDDVTAVASALRSDWLTTGPLLERFERAVATCVGAAHGVAVSSGTAALHAAMAAAGVGPGDEVITSPITFVASANAVLYRGAVPVFADVRPDTLLLDPARVEAKLTSRTRAVVPVDFAGQPCAMEPLVAQLRQRGICIIEDAAHALGASRGGQPAGALADLAIWSFHPAKHVTTGEGGMVTTSRDDLAAAVRRFRNHGLATEFREREARGDVWSPMIDLGYNYRLTEFQCALGLSQLTKLETFLKRRDEIAERYLAALPTVGGVSAPSVEPGTRHAWHIFPVLLDLERLTTDRRTVVAALRAENIGATVHYVPAYWHPHYERMGYRRGLCPRAELAFERLITLPLFPAMTARDVDDVLTALTKVLRYYRR